MVLIHEVLPLHLVILLLPGHIPASPQAPGRSGSCARSSRAWSHCGQPGSCGERYSSLGQSDSLLARLSGILGCADLLFLPYSRAGRDLYPG